MSTAKDRSREPFALPRTALALALFCLLGLPWLPADPAQAHGKSVSYSHWRLSEEGAEVSLRVALLELSRLPIPLPLARADGRMGSSRAVGEYLAEHIDLLTEAGPCRTTGVPRSRPAETGWVLYRWTLTCPQEATERIVRSRILHAQAPSHLHFARVSLLPTPDNPDSRILERVLTQNEPEWALVRDSSRAETGETAETTTGSSLAHYIVLGVEHILSGWDHLAFVLALILLARGLGEVARLVTGFTIAHSVTLGLAVMGWVEPQAGPVEAMIGFSVALIGLENGWVLAGRGAWIPVLTVSSLCATGLLAVAGFGVLPALSLAGLAVFSASHFGLLERAANPSLHRIALAFAFGLIHGFGFAGVLSELALPTERLVPALLGFNLGVEIGQLGVVALLWPALRALRRIAKGHPHRLLTEFASAAICAAGLYWFVTRSFGVS